MHTALRAMVGERRQGGPEEQAGEDEREGWHTRLGVMHEANRVPSRAMRSMPGVEVTFDP